MIRKSCIMLTLVGFLLLLQGVNAISWGIIDATPSTTIAYVERYGQEEIMLSVSYKPYLIGYMPVYVEVNVVGAPDWLTVVPSPQTFVIKPNEVKDVRILLKPSRQDIVAGTASTVEIDVAGKIVGAGMFRQVDRAKISFSVGYNPFTIISIRSPMPIERTSPDKELPFTIDIVNYGNSRVIVDLTPVESPKEWKYVISPSQVMIEPKQPGEDTYPYQQVTVTLTSPHGTVISYHNRWEDFSIQARAKADAPYYVKQAGGWAPSMEERELVNVHTVTAYFLAKNKGFYVPGFDAVFMLLAIAIVIGLIKKKK